MTDTQSVLAELRADIVTMRDFYSEQRDAAARMALGNVLILIDDLLPPPLLPCPFCGNTKVTYEFMKLAVFCNKCDACGPHGYDADATARWNTRVQP